MFRNLFLVFLAAVALLSCSAGFDGETERAAYYWNTTFALDSTKRQFLKEHHINKLYVRYFDVVANEYGDAFPNATIQFDSVVDCSCEIVPVVFIHNYCMKLCDEYLARKILKRVLQMSETHETGEVREIQIDCDWTKTTQENFFRFLQELRREIDSREKGEIDSREMAGLGRITLSTTIRLHQLSMPVPPVDKGVLMVYNTGDLRRLDIEKPIIDIHDVKPWLPALKDYNLPLVSAYPIYKWELLFRNGKFVDILHSPDELPILKSDSIVTREPAAEDILECKRAVESMRRDCKAEIILFDLNNFNIKRYTHEDFENFYN